MSVEGVGAMDRSAPERVWLQVDTDGNPEDRSEVIRRENWTDLTWHYEPIGGQEVEYIRTDLSTPAAAPGAGDGKWVPLEPTREMRAAGDSVVLRSGYRASDVFRAMVQEAPSMSCQTVIPGAPYIAISRTSKSPRPDLVRRLPALTHGIDLQKEAREARGIASAWKSKGDVGHAACMFHVACVFDSLAAAPTSEAHGCECDPAQNYVCDDCEGDAAPTSAPTPDRATPGERDALSALRKLAAKAAPGPYEYDSEHCTIVGNGHCPDCDDGCRHVHVDIEPSDLAFIIAAANYVSASLPQPIASSEAAPAVQCANCGDSKQEFSWNGDGPYPCRHCKQPSEAAHGEEEVEVLYRRDITEDGPWVRYSDYLKRQPAAAPGAVDDGTVARIAELIVAEMPSETVIQRCVASAVNKAALAALATKPDGPRADGGES
jgi:hypothetical protein